MSYSRFLRLLMNRLASQIGNEAIASLEPDLLCHIGECWRGRLSPNDCAALIVADYQVPVGREKVS